jgi:hypothetical protein
MDLEQGRQHGNCVMFFITVMFLCLESGYT